MSTTAGPAPVDITVRELATAASARVFFGHQSVGMNLLRAVSGVFVVHGVERPAIEDPADLANQVGGCFAHAAIGVNERPDSKIEDFDARMRGGIGSQVEVAMMKLCYVDVHDGTDVAGLFTTYRDTLKGLARDFPNVQIIAATVPLTTDPPGGRPLAAVVRSALGRPDRFGAAANVARERLNAMIREEFGQGALFDLAAIESTTPDGDRVIGRHGDAEYFALYDGYAFDQGHLNRRGARAAATAWLTTIAHAVAR